MYPTQHSPPPSAPFPNVSLFLPKSSSSSKPRPTYPHEFPSFHFYMNVTSQVKLNLGEFSLIQSFHHPSHSSIPLYGTSDIHRLCLLSSDVHSTADYSSFSNRIPAPQPRFCINLAWASEMQMQSRLCLSLSSRKLRWSLETPKRWPQRQRTASLSCTNLQLPHSQYYKHLASTI